MKSDTVRKGTQQAPHRSLFNALGMTKEEMDKPLVGIVSSYNEIVPGHMNLDKIVNAVKLGVAMAGGTPVVFPAIAVCDGIAMGHVGMKYSLVTRDLIADSTEAMALAHQFDALVMVPNCDKNVPGLLMAAARINVPTVFVSGGPMLAGHVKGHKTSLSSMFEAVGSYAAGTITADDLEEFENKTCPTCGSCSGMYTANSMNCLTEVLGMGLKGNGTIPAVYSERIRLAKHAGMQVMEMYRRNIRPRDIMTKEAVLNALYDVGITMNDVNPDYVVVGEGRSYSLDTLTKATNLVLKGAKLIGANSDVSGPIENGIAPACRALIAPIEMATGTQAYFCGKPNPLMMRTGLNMLGCHSAEAVMVGDRMDTDVISGMESGMSTVLVLSGCSTKDTLKTYAYLPTMVLNGVGDIASMAKAKEE